MNATNPTHPRPDQYRCRHVHTDGRRCGSASLRRENFCYYHHTTRRPAPRHKPDALAIAGDFHLAMPEDRNAVQQAIGEVLFRVAANQLDARRAALLLYGLQIASGNLPKLAKSAGHETVDSSVDLIDEVVADPELGAIAPLGPPLDPTRALDSYSRKLVKSSERRRQYAEQCLKIVLDAFPDAAPLFPPDPEASAKLVPFPRPEGGVTYDYAYPGDPEYPLS